MTARRQAATFCSENNRQVVISWSRVTRKWVIWTRHIVPVVAAAQMCPFNIPEVFLSG